LASALKITFSGSPTDAMTEAVLPRTLRWASSCRVSGPLLALYSICTSSMKMSPTSAAPAAGLPVVMRTLVPLLSAALMSPSWMVESAIGTKGVPGKVPAALPLTMVTSKGSTSHWPAVPFGAEASVRRPARSMPPLLSFPGTA
jgi:hypothetical protein